MTLAQLLQDLAQAPKALAQEPATLATQVTHVTDDSRAVKKGSIFVGIKGEKSDGTTYFKQALAQGALATIGEPGTGATIEVPNARRALAWLGARLAGEPSKKLLMIGVTGTSGKTTTTYLIESILKAAGHKVGVIGTVNFRIGDQVLPSTHTTPGPLQLQALLKQMLGSGCSAVVMEVSSHALKQHRTDAIAFDVGVFTNLSAEHLDFHPTLEDYFQSKCRLFTDNDSKKLGKQFRGIVSRDDPYGERLLAQADTCRGFDPAGLASTSEGTSGKIANINVESSLLGDFNRYNIAGAVHAALAAGIAPVAIEQGIRNLKCVPGRLELVDPAAPQKIFVDYAHKPDALQKVLATLRATIDKIEPRPKLITVFGCGGDRDRTKRPVMGGIAETLSDEVIVTSDNPRTEDPHAIIQEILKGTSGLDHVHVEPDRKRAIERALGMAQRGDWVLIAGKGHEDYQILGDGKGGTRKIHFDDREVAREILLQVLKL